MKMKITSDILEEKKRKYLEAKETLSDYLRKLLSVLNEAGEKPLRGEERKEFMDKFAMIDHRLLDRVDIRSYEYFEALELIEKQ